MSTDAIDTPATATPKKQAPSRRDRRAYYAMARRQAKIAKKPLAPWGQTPLCVPNPRQGWVVDGIDGHGKPKMRATVFGGTWDGTALQRAQCIRGSCLA
jgi:hypothetical protein